MQHLIRSFVVLAAFALAACGSGDDTVLAPPTGGDGGAGPVQPPAVQATTLTVTSSTSQLSADGTGTATIAALALDQNNNVVGGVPVVFVASSGALVVASGVTNENGVATAALTIGGDSEPRTITVTATSETLSDSTQVQVIGTATPIRTIQAVELSSDLNRIPSDGSTAANITAVVLGDGNNVLANVPVLFESNSGVLSVVSGITDAQGRAQATLAVGTNTTTRTITVTATAGEISTDIAIDVVDDVVERDVAELIMSASPDSLVSGSSETSLITMVAVDENNNAVPGVSVIFGASNGVLVSADTVTDSGGRAQAVFLPLGVAAGAVEISATAGGQLASTVVTIIASAPAVAASLTVTASLGQLPADGSATATIAALVVNADNIVMPGVPVSFTATSGALFVDSSVTDANGVATATLSIGGDTSNRVITVTAATGTLTETTQVEVVGTADPVREITEVQLSADQVQIPSDGSAPTTITAIVLGDGNNVVANVPVTFDADSGVVAVISGVSDTQGRAQATLNVSADPTPRFITLTVTAGDVSSDIIIEVVQEVIVREVVRLIFSVTPDTLIAGTSESALVSVVAVDVNNNAVPGVGVVFGANGGVLVSADTVTDDAGRAQAAFLPLGLGAGQVEVFVVAAGLTASAQVTIVSFEPVASVTLRSSPASIATDDSTSTNLTAQVLDQDNRAVEGVPVTFAADSGALVVTQGVTGVDGIATATLSAGANSAERTISVSATAGGRVGSTAVQVLSNPLLVDSVVLTTSTLELAADPSSSATLSVIVRDSSNNVLAGVPVTFSASSGSLAILDGATDANGVARAVLGLAGDVTPRTITVTASAGGLDDSIAIVVVARPALVATLYLLSDAPQLLSDGTGVAGLTAIVVDSQNNVISGIPVSFSSSAGVLSNVDTVTDEDGAARAELATGGPMTAGTTITVTVAAGALQQTLDIEIVETLDSLEVAEIQLLSTESRLPSAGTTEAEILAIVRDSSRNVLEGVPVAFAANSGSLQVIQAISGADGVARALLSTGANPANRTITVTGSAGGLSAAVDVEVVGTALTVTGPEALIIGDEGDFVVELTDSSGAGLPNRELTLVSALGNPITLLDALGNPITLLDAARTDAAGRLAFRLTANNAGEDTLTATSVDALALPVQYEVAISDVLFELWLEGDLPDQKVEKIPVDSGPVLVELNWAKGGVPIANEQVVLTTTRGVFADGGSGTSVDTVTTDENGQALARISSEDFGPARITASALGHELTTSRKFVFFATTPGRLIVQAWPSIVAANDESLIEAVVYDFDVDENVRNRVADQIVAFQIVDVTGGRLSDSLARTNEFGVATVRYIAGPTNSASGGVTVTATVQSDPAVNDNVTLTVVERQAFIVLGGDTTLGTSGVQYVREMVVQVTDIEGRAMPGVEVQARIRSDSYRTGGYGWDGTSWVQGIVETCVDEDTNRNGVLDVDAGEDRNENDRIDAGNIATVTPTGTILTDENGFGTLQVWYPKEYATWVDVELTALTTVSGTEFSRSMSFTLPIAAAELTNENVPPVALFSPFGRFNGCDTSPD